MTAGAWVILFVVIFMHGLMASAYLLGKLFDWWIESSVNRMAERERREQMKRLGIDEGRP